MKTKKSPKSKFNWYLALGALTTSILCHRLYLRYRVLPPIYASQHTTLDNLPHLPTELAIPTLNLSLPVIPAILDDNHWDTTSAGISYLTSTPLPGTHGNSVFYGHNYPNILGHLKNIKPGDEILINAQGVITHYQVSYTIIVPPSETSVYAPTDDTRLTIYTCIGLFDQNRFVVVAHPRP